MAGTRADRGRSTAWQVPLRVVTGAFILNSGMNKRGADPDTATALHGFAAGTYPQVKSMPPERFVATLSAGEIGLGAALLAVPVVPAAVAGAGLTGFAAGMLGLYARTPGMRQEGSIRPTEQGTALAKDVWMLGIGVSLLVGGLKGRRAAR